MRTAVIAGQGALRARPSPAYSGISLRNAAGTYFIALGPPSHRIHPPANSGLIPT